MENDAAEVTVAAFYSILFGSPRVWKYPIGGLVSEYCTTKGRANVLLFIIFPSTSS
jgi:hypothetical protein